MAFSASWFLTGLPREVIDAFQTDMVMMEEILEASALAGDTVNESIRRSTNCWLTTNHWISGFIWHYVMRANRENFRYDIEGIDFEKLQYTVYREGDFYRWHSDASLVNFIKPESVSGYLNTNEIKDQELSINCEKTRKLSFSLLLSDPSEFTGGDLQFSDPEQNWAPFFAPKERGSIIIFDSRVPHRVRKVTSGVRRSLVGWVLGPRWK
jgi:predicted 2-oxoglutarate/Fe(II)-dependent dioxygenase YbiX